MATFDHDYWRDASPAIWERRGLHWHCHSSRMDGETYGNEAARRDPAMDHAPKVIRDWLRKPTRTIRCVATTPEDGIAWLRAQWTPIRDHIGQEADAIPDQVRFGRALHDLRSGNDVCWGHWLGGTTHLHLALIGTPETCH
ncbi:hypothetical protein [Actinomadura harenae]|uniref:Uncharacterized protein n=1 Tax=Actinomadura harenae TaxID=2483351 RepID=A0A3M2MAT3_9ACTN|nr:hypothetical protein [Actinomadura harenae]RMI46602.1 hypothetical protein EBO15_06665 [Actinomadura harenae]